MPGQTRKKAVTSSTRPPIRSNATSKSMGRLENNRLECLSGLGAVAAHLLQPLDFLASHAFSRLPIDRGPNRRELLRTSKLTQINPMGRGWCILQKVRRGVFDQTVPSHRAPRGPQRAREGTKVRAMPRRCQSWT